jgi:hypothetical protein
VLGYCIEQENGGCIKVASEWRDRQWQQTAGVTLREVKGASRLLRWEGDDLFVMFYPVEKENEVRAKRVAGSNGGKASGQVRSKLNGSTASSTACKSASTERNGKERNTPIVPKGDEEREDSEASPSLPIDIESDPDFSEQKGQNGEEVSAVLLRARGLFRMRVETPLDSAQERAWRKNKAAVEATPDEGWRALEWWFSQPGTSNAARYRRKDLAQLLNHWNGEVERAHMEALVSGVEFSRTGGRKREVPADWREIILSECPEFNCPERFEEMPESVRAVVWNAVQKRKN